MVDTSVLVAGIAGLKPGEIGWQNSSATMLRDWFDNGTFIWIHTDEIILEYKTVLARLGVGRSTIGRVINLLNEEGELVTVSSAPSISPDPDDDPICLCSEQGAADFLVTFKSQGLSPEASCCSCNRAREKNSHDPAQEGNSQWTALRERGFIIAA